MRKILAFLGLFFIIVGSVYFLKLEKEKPMGNLLEDLGDYAPKMIETEKVVQKNVQNSVNKENENIKRAINEVGLNQKSEDKQNNLQSETMEETKDQNQVNDKNNQNSLGDNSELVKKYASAKIKTNFGDIEVKFYSQDSPVTVGNFLKLAKSGFYEKTKFHRVIKDFMIQGGDPNSKDDNWENDGLGGPGYKFQDEFNDHKLVAGSLAMANSGTATNGSQFFIVTAESTPWLDGKHTNFGEVVEGMDVIKKIEKVEVNEKDHPTKDIMIEKIELLEK